MSTFDKVRSGIPDMDIALDHIRLGDNVVWRVDDLWEFKVFLKPFIRQAVQDKRNIVYVRFASHEPLIDADNIKTVNIPLSHRFETFTLKIHDLIEKEGPETFYVFDCLSDLQTAWATDLMMSNFFMVTCPFLFKLDTVTYFPILRGIHSFSAVAKIRDTTQLFLDVFSDHEADDPDKYNRSDIIYVKPLKVWKRFSETMFMPHEYSMSDHHFRPLQDGIKVSSFYRIMNKCDEKAEEFASDSWTRFFQSTIELYRKGADIRSQEDHMCDIMMTRDNRMRKIIKRNFHAEDYFQIRKRMIGTGMIGGKACGMLTARKIIENRAPDIFRKLEPHDSYYIGSDVFYTFIVENDMWDLRVRQRTKEGYFEAAGVMAERFKNGRFPDNIHEQFKRLLDYYGQAPVIVRSSSILEDGFGNAFAGKYESVFCANSGTGEERLTEFENAVRTVYASTLSRSALDYRIRRGLENRDEQMALLVQRVSGSRFGNDFMPMAAGVGYSYSPYRFMENIDSSAGMLRLVMGLGTGAVDRALGSYPRVLSLDKPRLTPYTTSAMRHRFSQRRIECIDLEKKEVAGKRWDEFEGLPEYFEKYLLEHDFDAESMFRERGIRKNIRFISCLGLASDEDLMNDLKKLMHVIQSEYDHPVDIEYTINLSPSGEYVINLLQCRPLQVMSDSGEAELPDISDSDTFIKTVKASMGLSCRLKTDYIVYVDPETYYRLEYAEKPYIAKIIGSINWYFRNKNKGLVLLTPGRVGTSSPELGVPTVFSDISEFSAICEIADSKAGYNPELSYGSHIFQDLVESNILYNAVFESRRTVIYAPEKIREYENIIGSISEDYEEFSDCIGLYKVNCTLYHDIDSGVFLLGREKDQ